MLDVPSHEHPGGVLVGVVGQVHRVRNLPELSMEASAVTEAPMSDSSARSRDQRMVPIPA